jgi:acetolactate synthase-1/2/3 large subunit
MNFPADHPMHLGYDDFVQPNPFLPKADVIVVLDSDFPWLTQNSTRNGSAKLFWIDADPIKETIPLWYYSGQQPYRADAHLALRQIRHELSTLARNEKVLERRKQTVAAESRRLRQEWEKAEAIPSDNAITPEYLTRVIRELRDDDTVVLNETITNYGVVWRHLQNRTLGGFYGSGGSSLGWHGGAAIGVKLAHPNKTVIALTGDGSYLFSVPSAVHLTAAKYGAPFLTVIYNNGGWKAPKASTLAVHPQGYAQQHGDFKVEFYPDAQLARVAEVVPGTYTATVKEPDALKAVLTEALTHVRSGHSAVVDVRVRPL